MTFKKSLLIVAALFAAAPAMARDWTLLDAQSGTNRAFVFVTNRAPAACSIGNDQCVQKHRELAARIAKIATDMEVLEKEFPEPSP